MCIHTLRILARCTFTVRTITGPAGGPIALPDMSRSYMFWCVQGGILVPVYYTSTPSGTTSLAWDSRFSTQTTNQRVYTRESLGPHVMKQMWTTDPGAAGSITLVSYEMNDEAMDMILRPEL